MKRIKKIISISLITISSLSALSLDELKEMPKSIEKDFYIWRFISDKNTTKEDAVKSAKMIFRVNSKLSKAYKRKTSLSLPKRVYRPSQANVNRYKTLIKQLNSSDDFYQSWLKLNDSDKLIIFTLGGKEIRAKLDKKLDSQTYENLTKQRNINQFIFRILKENLPKLKDTILTSKPIKTNKISYNNLLLLGFKDLKLGNRYNAAYFFYNAIYKAPTRFYADRAIFWLYMATKKIQYLKKVANSYDFNMYKLIALDFLNLPYPMPATAKLSSTNKPNIDITNPIDWAKLKKQIFSKKANWQALANKYNSIYTPSYYYYILNKASRDTKQYFPILHRDILSKYPIDRQAMLLALGRQESHFIPASVSSSFALGMMQFMPFLVKHIAKVRHQNVKLEDMFNPKIALEFANTHLDYLNKHLYNPIFVAYAYNAGIGYTRRMIRKNIFKEGAYEPYISLELVDNSQANHYAKKVLANYIIYRMLLGKPIKITKVINELTHPELTDRFRK